MKLSGKDRLVIQGIFPEGGNFLTIEITKDVLKKISLSQEEAKLIGVKIERSPQGDKVYWDDKKEGLVSKDVTFTEAELEYMTKIIDKMDAQNQITVGNSDTLKKIREAAKVKEK